MKFKEIFDGGLIKKPFKNEGDFKHWREEIIKQYHKECGLIPMGLALEAPEDMYKNL